MVPTYQMASPSGASVDPRFVADELRKIQRSLDVLVRMTPQVATKAPPVIADGMIRLARAPWWPVAGQVQDAWVHYDAVLGSWQYL